MERGRSDLGNGQLVAAIGASLLAIAAAALGCVGEEETGSRIGKKTSLVCDREGVAACARGGSCAAKDAACRDGCCLRRCAAAADCVEESGCGALGCTCDAGVCQQLACSAAGDCPEGQGCQAGACVETRDPREAVRCELAPLRGLTKQGVEAPPSHLTLYDDEGRVLFFGEVRGALSSGLSLRSTEASRGSLDQAGALVGGGEPGPYRLRAEIGAASCEAQRINLQAIGEGELRVAAVDELSGLALEGVTVQVEAGGSPAIVETGADGAARFAVAELPSPPWTISLFHERFMYLTVVGVEGRDLLVPLRRSITMERAGGIKGRFDPRAFDPALLNAGLVGMSIPGNLVDLSFTMLLGRVERVEIDLGGAREVDIPQGIVLGLGNTWFKDEYQALGLAGNCAEEERVEEGSCGLAAAWGLAGGMPLEELPLDQLTEGGEHLDVGQLLSHLLPHVRGFRSTIVRDVSYQRPPTKVVGGKRVPDSDRFERIDMRPSMRMALFGEVALPPLPATEGSTLDGAIVLAGALTEGRGFTPLGITAGVDSGVAAGGQPSGEISEPGGRPGSLGLRLAPLHGGLEGSEYLVLALAVNLSRLMEEGATCTAADPSGCAAIAGVATVRERLPSGETIDLRPGGFVGFADGAIYDDDQRRFILGGPIEGEPNLLRLSLGSQAARWMVYFPAGVESFSLPLPPMALADRASGARASLQAMRILAPLDELFGYGDRWLARVSFFTESFSSKDLPLSGAAEKVEEPTGSAGED